MFINNSLLDDDQNNDTGAFTANTMSQYEKLAYWVKFYSIIGFIFLGLGVLALLGLLFAASALPENNPISRYMVGITVGTAVALGFFTWYISLLWGYGKALQEFADSRDEKHLEAAMDKRKVFFITTIVLTALSILFTISAASQVIR